MARVTVDFSDESFQVLTDISKQLNSTKAEALRKALAFLKLTLEEKAEGSSLIFENKKKNSRKELAII